MGQFRGFTAALLVALALCSGANLMQQPILAKDLYDRVPRRDGGEPGSAVTVAPVVAVDISALIHQSFFQLNKNQVMSLLRSSGVLPNTYPQATSKHHTAAIRRAAAYCDTFIHALHESGLHVVLVADPITEYAMEGMPPKLANDSRAEVRLRAQNLVINGDRRLAILKQAVSVRSALQEGILSHLQMQYSEALPILYANAEADFLLSALASAECVDFVMASDTDLFLHLCKTKCLLISPRLGVKKVRTCPACGAGGECVCVCVTGVCACNLQYVMPLCHVAFLDDNFRASCCN